MSPPTQGHVFPAPQCGRACARERAGRAVPIQTAALLKPVDAEEPPLRALVRYAADEDFELRVWTSSLSEFIGVPGGPEYQGMFAVCWGDAIVTVSAAMSQEEKIECYRNAVRHYVEAVNSKDLEGILALYAEDAQVHDPIFHRDFSGKAALREFYAGVITRAQLEILGPIRGSYRNVVATPVKARVPGLEIDVITLTTFDDQGLISDYAAYWGPTDVHKVES